MNNQIFLFSDLKSSHTHTHTNVNGLLTHSLLDRNANSKHLSSSSLKSHQQMNISSSQTSSTLRPTAHPSINTSQHSSYPSTPTSHPSNHHQSLGTYTSNSSKYDLNSSAHHLHASTPSYLHSNQLTSTPSSFGQVKSESSTPSSYDYMNNCLQSGYFGGTFSALANHSAGGHTPTDLAGYHHQHNVIQAAKLMASS